MKKRSKTIQYSSSVVQDRSCSVGMVCGMRHDHSLACVIIRGRYLLMGFMVSAHHGFHHQAVITRSWKKLGSVAKFFGQAQACTGEFTTRRCTTFNPEALAHTLKKPANHAMHPTATSSVVHICHCPASRSVVHFPKLPRTGSGG